MEKGQILIENFLTWLGKNSANKPYINKTKIENLPIFGNSLITTQKIRKNEIVLEIPQHLFLSMENACKDKMIQRLIINKNLYFDKKTIFAFFLLLQICLKEQSFWHPYFQVLPKSYTNTITWKDEEIQILKRKDLIDSFRKKRKYAENEFTKIKDIIEKDEEAHSIINLKDFQLEIFLLLFSLIESRTLYYPNSFDSESIIGTLVPYYDFCNHAFLKDINAFDHFYYEKNRNSYVLKAYKEFEVNEQVFICYGNYNNLHFLELYGFLPFENISNNYIEIQLELDLKKVFAGEAKTIFKNFDKKMAIIKKILPHFCKKIKGKKKQWELETSFKLQIEEIKGKSKFSWEIESLIFILSSDFENLEMKDVEGFLFNDLEKEIENDAQCNLFLNFLKNYILNDVFLFSHDKPSKKNNKYRAPSTIREILAHDYSKYEINMINLLNY